MSSSPTPLEMLVEILNDNRTGSTGLALKTIEFFSSIKGKNRKFLKSVRDRLNSAHAGLGLVRNVSDQMYKALIDSEKVEDKAIRLRLAIENQIEEALSRVGSMLHKGCTICTISNSSMVRKALIANREKISEVLVMESRPLLEGQELSLYLEKKGLKSTVVLDSAIRVITDRCDLALVGSDSVLGDLSLIHKVGTFPLLMAMKHLGKEIISLTIDLKFESEFTSRTYPEFRRHSEREIVSRNQRALNEYFDITPGGIVGTYISNSGIVKVGENGNLNSGEIL